MTPKVAFVTFATEEAHERCLKFFGDHLNLVGSIINSKIFEGCRCQKKMKNWKIGNKVDSITDFKEFKLFNERL